MCEKVVDFLRRYWFYFFVFAIASLLRFVPELFSSVYPAGYDIPFYIFELKLMESGLSWDQLYFANPPLAYLLLLFVRGVSRLDWFVLFKFFNPLLNGFVAVSFLYFLRNGLGLNWRVHEYLICVLLFVFSNAGIIMSNGVIKQQLALFFFFLFWVYFKRGNWKGQVVCVVLVALSHLMIIFLLFVLLLLDFVYDAIKNRSIKRNNLLLCTLGTIVVIVFLFLLPTLSSVNPLGEMFTHIGSYFSDTSYGFKFNTAPIINKIYYHFNWYFGWWFGILIFAFSLCYMKHRLNNFMLLSLFFLGFLGIGTIWARWQWLLVLPFVVIIVSGTRNNKFTRFLPMVFLLFIIVNGCMVSTNPDLNMARSSVRFEEIEGIKANYAIIHDNITWNVLIIDSTPSIAWTQLALLGDGKNHSDINEVFVVAERTISFMANESGLFMYRDGIKGHDFYVFRTNEFWVHLDAFNHVFVVNVRHFVDSNPFDVGYWDYFKYYGEYKGEIVYRYWRPT